MVLVLRDRWYSRSSEAIVRNAMAKENMSVGVLQYLSELRARLCGGHILYS